MYYALKLTHIVDIKHWICILEVYQLEIIDTKYNITKQYTN